MEPGSALLQMSQITKAFPGVKALDRVDFAMRAGEVHALLGENGAGKSTLIKVLTGYHPPDAGQIYLEGQPIHPRSPAHACKLGISTVFQEVNLIPDLPVAENIFLGRQPFRHGRIQWGRLNQAAQESLARLDIHLDVQKPLRSFSIAIQQMAAIARALDAAAKILVLDEPTSSLDRHEVENLFATLRKLKRQGLGILFITHFLDQVYAISDRITVLRNGQLIGEYPAETLPRLELVSRMIGKSVEELQRKELASAPPKTDGSTPVFMEIAGLGKKGSLAPCSFNIRKGEITGLAGLLGSGRTELAHLLFGILKADSGAVTVGNQPAAISSPRKAMSLGIGLLPEDRKIQGILPDLSIRENIILSMQVGRGWWRPLSRAKQQKLCDQYIRALNIATPDAEKPAGQLSGGNQQKVILARWLASGPKLLILDEPTRGIDIGAKAEIESLMGQLCAEGMAILFISGELEEVVRDSHRVMILRDRKKIAELSGREIELSRILRIIVGDENPSNV